MTNIFLDVEFNGFGGKLISMALVPDNGAKTWYKELKLPNKVDPWVQENVVPYLTEDRPLTFTPFKKSFQKYISKFDKPTIICDWFQDAIFFLDLLKGKEHGQSLNFTCEIRIIKTDNIVYKHNALDDALILKEWFKTRHNE